MELASKHLQKLLTIQTAEGKKLSTIKHIIGFITRAVNFAKKNGYKIPELEPQLLKLKTINFGFFQMKRKRHYLLNLTLLVPFEQRQVMRKNLTPHSVLICSQIMTFL